MEESKFMEYECPICGKTLLRLQDSYGYYFTCNDDECSCYHMNLCEDFISELSNKLSWLIFNQKG